MFKKCISGQMEMDDSIKLNTIDERPKQNMFDCSAEIDNYKCKTCLKYETMLLTALKEHVEDNHRNEIYIKEAYICLKCHFVTYSRYFLVRHFHFTDCAPNNKFESNQLEFSQTSKWNLSQLSSAGTGWQCEHCPSKYKRKKDLKVHVLHSHSNPDFIEWFNCPHCPSKFKRKQYLKAHTLRIHTKPEDIKWFQCEQCPSRFKQKNTMTQHIKHSHSNPEDIQWFQCEQCPSKFKLRGNLKKHTLFLHTKPEDINWFQCEHCPSKFKTKGSLKKHVGSIIHSKPDDIQWFQCELCPSKFKQKRYFVRHKRKIHPRPEDGESFECQQG